MTRNKIKSNLLPVTCYLSPAFTLIELLIVITIIGILASLTLASYSGTQAKARDTVRKSDLNQIKRAMEIAKSNCMNAAWYPVSPNMGGGFGDKYNSLGNYLTTLKYVSKYPNDPSVANGYNYDWDPSTSNMCPDLSSNPNSLNGSPNYALWVLLERTADADGAASRARCNGKAGHTWTGNEYVVCND